MILAAAIKFHIENTDKDVVLCGHRHWNIYEQLKLLGFELQKGYKEVAQGFIDDKNNFLPSLFFTAFSNISATCIETKSAPIAVSDTAQNPIFFKAAINCSGVNSENSEINDGANDAITFLRKVKS